MNEDSVLKSEARSWEGEAPAEAPRRDDPAGGQVSIRRLFLAAAWASPPPAAIALAGRAEAPVWEGAAALARRVNQEPLFHHFVASRFPNAPLRPETMLDLENQSRFHAFRWEEIRDAARTVLDALGNKSICPVLLKGISQAGERYDPPRLRPMRDLDLLVEPGDVDPAQEAAAEAGFVPDPARHPAEKYRRHHHLPPLFHRETGVCLEIHHHLLNLPEHFEGFPSIDEIWRSVRRSRLYPGKALVLEPALEVLTTCAHITHGDSIGRRAQNLIDLARTLEIDGPDIDRDRLGALASGPDAARALAVPLLYLAREGLAAAPESTLAMFRKRSGLCRWELDLLCALIDRYRIGAPPAWPLVSGRISNILWRQALRKGSVIGRAVAAAAEAIAGRFGR